MKRQSYVRFISNERSDRDNERSDRDNKRANDRVNIRVNIRTAERKQNYNRVTKLHKNSKTKAELQHSYKGYTKQQNTKGHNTQSKYWSQRRPEERTKEQNYNKSIMQASEGVTNLNLS